MESPAAEAAAPASSPAGAAAYLVALREARRGSSHSSAPHVPTAERIQTTLREGELSGKQRKALPAGAFVYPDDERYPIHDLEHARNALSRVAQHGSSAEQAKVRAAVYRKYPQLKSSSGS